MFGFLRRIWITIWCVLTNIWFLCPPGVRTYGELPSGELCSDGREIKSEKECRKAAKTLEMEFGQAWTGNNGFPGCLIANDGRNKVYFNLSPTPSTVANNPEYGAICIKTTTAGEFLLKPFRYDSISLSLSWYLYLSLSLVFGQVMSPHHSDQMSQRSQVSRTAPQGNMKDLHWR